MSKIVALFLCVACMLTLLTGCGGGLRHVEIVVENYGSIFLELDADVAPKTVRNFIKLAEEGFYDGLTFHRVEYGFVIQGGCPNGNGTGGSGDSIKGEFAANGHRNSISHRRGVISMARGSGFDGEYDSASSQFFIMVQDNTGLNGLYASFGYVTEGMDVVDAIVTDVTLKGYFGAVAPEDQPVITTIRVLD